MQPITPEWLHERGLLHDARVVDVRINGPVIEIMLDDEWTNERGLSQPRAQKAPGALVVKDFSVTDGGLGAVIGGWVSEVTMSGDQLHLVFGDRPALYISTGEAWWRSGS